MSVLATSSQTSSPAPLPAGGASSHEPSSHEPNSHVRHYAQLDSLRGVAAAVVVLSHFTRLWEPASLNPAVRHALSGPLLPLVNGSASVTLFFLLSGFVLSLPFKRRRPLRYGSFVLRRLARIYLPYLAAFALALAADAALHHPVALSAWFNQTWSQPITWRLVLDHVLMIGNYDTAQVNTAFWSLPIEMRVSLAFPLLCLPLLFWRPAVAVALAAGLAVADLAAIHVFSTRLNPVSFTNLSEMMAGLVAFAAGILLCRWQHESERFFRGCGTGVRLLIAGGAFLALEYAERLSGTRLWPAQTMLAVAGGTGVLLAALASHRLAAALEHPVPSWLGRISYSLYLVHATVLFTLGHLLAARFGPMGLLLPYLALSLLLSWLFFLGVERPAIALSRSIGQPKRK